MTNKIYVLTEAELLQLLKEQRSYCFQAYDHAGLDKPEPKVPELPDCIELPTEGEINKEVAEQTDEEAYGFANGVQWILGKLGEGR